MKSSGNKLLRYVKDSPGETNQYLIAILLLTICISCTSKRLEDEARFIAEWEVQKEVYVGFRTLDQDSMYDYVSIRMIRKLADYIHTKVIVEDSSLLPEGMQFFADNDIDTSNLEVVYESPTYYWIRDPAPILFKDSSGETCVADFRFGNYIDVPVDSVDQELLIFDDYDRKFASKNNLKFKSSGLVIEGGAFETNGNGSLILIESIIRSRNPGWTRAQVELELMNKFNVKTIIWLPKGLAEDPYYAGHLYEDFFAFGTGGHSDEFVRFANDSTILLAWEFSEPDESFPLREINIKAMTRNLEILENAVDWRGKRFKVVKIPIPEIFYNVSELDPPTFETLKVAYPDLNLTSGQEIKIVACAGYLNYLITNGLVIIPSYWTYGVPESQQIKDSIAKSIFEGLYPDREIFQINPLMLNYGGGGMHCTYFSYF